MKYNAVCLFFVIVPLCMFGSDRNYLNLSETSIGIRGLFEYSPDTAKPLRGLAQQLLDTRSSLSRGERELIAARVSFLNDCEFCHKSHSAVAAYLLKGSELPIDVIVCNPQSTHVISDKLRMLLKVAECVQRSGKDLTMEVVTQAYEVGVTKQELHDTVLIAAAFCMFNRYVDGLGALLPKDSTMYSKMGEQIAAVGYVHKLFT